MLPGCVAVWRWCGGSVAEMMTLTLRPEVVVVRQGLHHLEQQHHQHKRCSV